MATQPAPAAAATSRTARRRMSSHQVLAPATTAAVGEPRPSCAPSGRGGSSSSARPARRPGPRRLGRTRSSSSRRRRRALCPGVRRSPTHVIDVGPVGGDGDPAGDGVPRRVRGADYIGEESPVTLRTSMTRAALGGAGRHGRGGRHWPQRPRTELHGLGRVAGSERNSSRTDQATVSVPGFFTPRIDTHRRSAP